MQSIFLQGLLDDPGMAVVKQSAQATQTAVDNQQWERATDLWSLTELAVSVLQLICFTTHNDVSWVRQKKQGKKPFGKINYDEVKSFSSMSL